MWTFGLVAALLIAGSTMTTGNSDLATAAQEATPGALAGHPLVGTWIVDTDVDMASDPPEVGIFNADGTVFGLGASRWVSGAWEAAVRTWAWSYRDVFAVHTPLIPVIAVLPVTDAPQTLAMYETVSKGFADAGFPQEHIIPAIVALESFIFGSAYDVTAPEDIFESGSMAESTPYFTAAVRSSASRRDAPAGQERGRPADTAFHRGLEALITGFGAIRK